MITKYIILFLLTLPFTETCMITQHKKRKKYERMGTISYLDPDVQNKIISALFVTYDTNQNGVDEKTLKLFKKTNLNIALQILKEAAQHQKSLPMLSASQLFRITREQIGVCKTTYNRTDYVVRPGNIISKAEAETIRTLHEDIKQAFKQTFVEKKGPFYINRPLPEIIKALLEALRETQLPPGHDDLFKIMFMIFSFSFSINILNDAIFTVPWATVPYAIITFSSTLIIAHNYFFPVFNKKRIILIDI